MSGATGHGAGPRGARLLAICCVAGILLGGPVGARAADSGGWSAGSAVNWGGHLRLIGTGTRFNGDSIDESGVRDPGYDGQLEWRAKNRTAFGRHWRIDTHYELVVLGGDAYEKARSARTLPGNLAQLLGSRAMVDDERRLLDLTHILDEEERSLAYHRLDRLSLTHTADWGTLKLGRQALTWGNGLIFNPMDLFNPFSPTAVQRDYKVGDDMALLQLPLNPGELQLLYLPRRNPATGDPEEDFASYAAKYHTYAGTWDLEAMAARHYGDAVAGVAASGTWGGAAWRVDTLYTRLDGGDGRDGFWQVVANLDYAWVWGGRNVYGLLEFYYNGLGRTDAYGAALSDTDLVTRLARGELFTSGRHYLSGQMQVELHPLLRLKTTAIVNAVDPSGVIQPQLYWDASENLQLILGGQWNWGQQGSEFGGYALAGDSGDLHVAPDDRLYIWLTGYY